LGLFDRPAEPGCLEALRKAPVIEGLTEALVDLDEDDWNITLTQLHELGLISLHSSFSVHHSSLPVDAHPLVREYFARQLQDRRLDAWRAAHRRLYEHLCETTEQRPDTLAGLQPLYQAVAHGCQAGLEQKACADVYVDRILRGTAPGGFYSLRQLGAIGADLAAVACLFERPWSRPSPNLSPADQAWLLNQAAFRLRALGRLTEAVEPMRAGLEMRIEQEVWKSAAIIASNLSELELTLGEVSAAVSDGEQSVTFADRSADAFWRMGSRTTHADALHQAGRREESLALFREAEAIQAEWQPEYPRLYSFQGFRYCDLLLADAERAAWRATVGWVEERDPRAQKSASENVGLASSTHPTPAPPYDLEACAAACDEVAERATETLEWAQQFHGAPLLDFAVNHLTLGRATLYRAILDQARRPNHQSSIIDHQSIAAAVAGLRASGQTDHLPRGLLTRAWLRFLEGDESGARADLDEAWEIAERGPMRLHMADVQLTRARLFRDREALEAAAELIEKCGYHRRDGELADARELMIDDR
jgi:tetratricopeptide (TPR) repeat protein